MEKFSKLILAVCVFAVSLLQAQLPPKPVDPNGGTGTTGTGAQSVPVDMYVYALGIIAVMLIIFYTNKYKSRKI
ncbi:signal peptidase [Chryseobacterium sp. GMJ5]|uniref:Signal peptidase n=1 Tax=Chryseobacterium gilvum TaxID=2976534 RepID=A0ABT2W483_9FLAO|nr:signal peptidase [Chryseobacterium gilvum]MCU7615545.1 signal peptidase [Chryseobacterium gilvum]